MLNHILRGCGTPTWLCCKFSQLFVVLLLGYFESGITWFGLDNSPHALEMWRPSRMSRFIRLRGGTDSGIPEVEDAKFAEREAMWAKWREEWEYCTGDSERLGF